MKLSGVDISILVLITQFFSELSHTVYLATLDDGTFFLGFLVLFGFNVLFAIIAGLLVFAVVNWFVFFT